MEHQIRTLAWAGSQNLPGLRGQGDWLLEQWMTSNLRQLVRLTFIKILSIIQLEQSSVILSYNRHRYYRRQNNTQSAKEIITASTY